MRFEGQAKALALRGHLLHARRPVHGLGGALDPTALIATDATAGHQHRDLIQQARGFR